MLSDARKKTCEFPKYYSLPYLTHGVKVICQIVHGVQRLGQQFIRGIQMPQVSPGIATADLARTGRVEWTIVGCVARVLDGDAPFRGEQQAVPRRARW